MTAATFQSWVISVLLPQVRLHHPQVPADILTRTAVHWINQLRFEQSSTKVFTLMAMKGVMWWTTGKYICANYKHLSPPMLHPHPSVMNLHLNHRIVNSWSSSFMMEVYSIQMAIKVGCGLRKLNNQSSPNPRNCG